MSRTNAPLILSHELTMHRDRAHDWAAVCPAKTKLHCNAKPNFNHLCDDIGAVLMRKYGVTRVVKHQKRAPSVPAGDTVMKQFVDECDLVVTGSGD